MFLGQVPSTKLSLPQVPTPVLTGMLFQINLVILIACLCLLRFIGSWFLFPVYLKCHCFHKSQWKNRSPQGLKSLLGRRPWGPWARGEPESHHTPTPALSPLRKDTVQRKHRCPLGPVGPVLPGLPAARPPPSSCVEGEKSFSPQTAKGRVPLFSVWTVFVEENHRIASDTTPAVMEARAGVFVPIFKHIIARLCSRNVNMVNLQNRINLILVGGSFFH